jgi:hypothetical protein
MVLSTFSGRRIKKPEQGLLAMHPFADVLEGRSMFTATLHDGMLDVTAVVDAAPGEDSPWSNEPVVAEDLSAEDAAGSLGQFLANTTPGHIALKSGTVGSVFASDTLIGDSASTLFGNAFHDRRGRFDPQPLPSDEQIAAARANMVEGSPFCEGRPLTGAMRPYLTMTVQHETHPFAL